MTLCYLPLRFSDPDAEAAYLEGCNPWARRVGLIALLLLALGPAAAWWVCLLWLGSLSLLSALLCITVAGPSVSSSVWKALPTAALGLWGLAAALAVPGGPATGPAMVAAVLFSGALPWRWAVVVSAALLAIQTAAAAAVAGQSPPSSALSDPGLLGPYWVFWGLMAGMSFLGECRDRHLCQTIARLRALGSAVPGEGLPATVAAFVGPPATPAVEPAAGRTAVPLEPRRSIVPTYDGALAAMSPPPSPPPSPPTAAAATLVDDPIGALREVLVRRGLRSRPGTLLLCRATLEAEDCANLQTQARTFVDEVRAAAALFHGTVHHLTADTALLCWNLFAFHPTHEGQACHCALHLDQRLRSLLGRPCHAVVTSAWFVAGLLPQADDAPEAALPVVHGKCVHVARRLLQLTRTLDCSILITDSVQEAVQYQYATLPVDAVRPEGLDRTIRVHCLLPRSPFVAPAEDVSAYRQGFAALEARQLPLARSLLTTALLSPLPDPAAHAQRLLQTAMTLQMDRSAGFGRLDGWEPDRFAAAPSPSPHATPPSGVPSSSPSKRPESPVPEGDTVKRGVRFGAESLAAHEGGLVRKASSLRRRKVPAAVTPPLGGDDPGAPCVAPPPLLKLPTLLNIPELNDPSAAGDNVFGSTVGSFRFGRDVSSPVSMMRDGSSASPTGSFAVPRSGPGAASFLRPRLPQDRMYGSPTNSFLAPELPMMGSFRRALSPSMGSFRGLQPSGSMRGGPLARSPSFPHAGSPDQVAATNAARRRLSRWSATSDSDLVAEDMPPGLHPIGNAVPFTTPTRKGTPRLWYLSDTLLGEGGYGGVYLGMSDCGSLVAVKRMEIAPEKNAQLRNEVKLLSKFQNPSIVAYLGSAVVGPHVLVVMEYAPTSVAKLLANFGKLSEPCVRRYGRDILHGLRYLHAHNVIHRDIKPQNVLIGQSGRCKLADFGTAALLHKVEQGGDTVMGTPHYMAPEVVRGQVGPEADVWAMGVTVWEMLTGHLIDNCQEMTNVVAVMFHFGMMTEAPQIPHEFSEDLRDFLRGCLCPDPARRAMAEGLLRHRFVL